MSNKSWKRVWLTGPGPNSNKDYIMLYLKGFLMGIADLIPGVSGGTVAFITGIYSSLLDAVASIDREFFKYLLCFDIKNAMAKIHIRFIIPLLFGIASAMFGLARMMHFLMNEHPIPTWGAFFGLIAASVIVIWKQIDDAFSIRNIFALICGAAFAYILVSLIPVETSDSFWFIYLCGIIGITAMILPGISGSFLLLILGKYEYITGMLKNPFADGAVEVIFIFLCGTVSGLLGFSKILNYFMTHYRQVTMAFLTGILIGSMKKVWPWKVVLESVEIRGKIKVIREANIFPSTLNTENFTALVLILLGFFLVIFLESRASSKTS